MVHLGTRWRPSSPGLEMETSRQNREPRGQTRCGPGLAGQELLATRREKARLGGYENILELVPMPVCIPLTSHRPVHHEGLSGQCGNHNVWLLSSSPPPQGRPQFPCGTGRGAFNTAPLLRGSELETLPSPCSTPWAIWPEQTPLPLWASVSASVQWTHDHTRLTAFMCPVHSCSR